jgi:hypothetical protein
MAGRPYHDLAGKESSALSSSEAFKEFLEALGCYVFIQFGCGFVRRFERV